MKPTELKVNIKRKGLKDIEKRILELRLEIANQEIHSKTKQAEANENISKPRCLASG